MYVDELSHTHTHLWGLALTLSECRQITRMFKSNCAIYLYTFDRSHSYFAILMSYQTIVHTISIHELYEICRENEWTLECSTWNWAKLNIQDQIWTFLTITFWIISICEYTFCSCMILNLVLNEFESWIHS